VVRTHSLNQRVDVGIRRITGFLRGHSRTAFTMDVYAHVLSGMGEQVASAIETALGKVN
jgi:hypothetical protein